jgi:hypothetical protein
MGKMGKRKYGYMLRTCNSLLQAHGGFQWPSKGSVEAPDWKPVAECGNGLHGLLWGEGNGALLDWSEDAKWLVVKVLLAEVIDIKGKVKVPSGSVVYCGNRKGAIEKIKKLGAKGPIVGDIFTGGDNSTLTGGYGSTLTGGKWSTLTSGKWSTLTSGDNSTLIGGDNSTLIGGDNSTLTGGDNSTLTGGYGSTLTGGDDSTLTGGERSTLTGGKWSTLTSGKWSTLTSGYNSTLTGGDNSTLTGGERSTLTGGDYSTLTGGERSTLTGGDNSTLIGGDNSTLSGGDNSTLCIIYWDSDVRRIATAVVGQDGIKAGVSYRLNKEFKFEEVRDEK